MNRKEFLKCGFCAAAASLAPRAAVSAEVPAFAKGAEDMGPILADAEIRRRPGLKGRKCSYFCDDAIWALRDITRQRPKSMFDHPFFSVLKECHEKYGLKMQINLFYRTDFFYGMDEFTLADVTDAYKAEFAASADWLKLGFHSLQEFPDYPWINASYADVKKLFDMTHGEVVRFAGEQSFAWALMGTIVNGQSHAIATFSSVQFIDAFLPTTLGFKQASDVSLLFAIRSLRRACML